MRTTKITLAGQEYEVQELPSRENAAWRERLGAPNTIEARRDLLTAYAPALAEQIAAAYDSEVLVAFQEVTQQLGDPLAQWRRVHRGPEPPST